MLASARLKTNTAFLMDEMVRMYEALDGGYEHRFL